MSHLDPPGSWPDRPSDRQSGRARHRARHERAAPEAYLPESGNPSESSPADPYPSDGYPGNSDPYPYPGEDPTGSGRHSHSDPVDGGYRYGDGRSPVPLYAEPPGGGYPDPPRGYPDPPRSRPEPPGRYPEPPGEYPDPAGGYSDGRGRYREPGPRDEPRGYRGEPNGYAGPATPPRREPPAPGTWPPDGRGASTGTGGHGTGGANGIGGAYGIGGANGTGRANGLGHTGDPRGGSDAWGGPPEDAWGGSPETGQDTWTEPTRTGLSPISRNGTRDDAGAGTDPDARQDTGSWGTSSWEDTGSWPGFLSDRSQPDADRSQPDADRNQLGGDRNQPGGDRSRPGRPGYLDEATDAYPVGRSTWADERTSGTGLTPPGGIGTGVPDTGTSAWPSPDEPTGTDWNFETGPLGTMPAQGTGVPRGGPGPGTPVRQGEPAPDARSGPDGTPGPDGTSGPDGTGPETTPPKRNRAGRNLPAAIGVGVTLGAVVLASLFVWRPAFVFVAVLAVGTAVWEMTRAVATGDGPRVPLPPLLAGTAVMMSLAWFAGVEALILGLVLTVLATMVWRLADGPAGYQRDVLAAALVSVYVPFMAGFAVALVRPHDGDLRVLTMLAIVVLSDTCGYAAGVLLGRHPMAPTISPKKSWEGLAGSLVGTAIGGALLVFFLFDRPWWHGALFGLAVSAVSVLGDLAESLLKRDMGIKDMSSLLPGHGGLMDRLDSILFAAPVAFVLLSVLAPVSV